MTPDERFETLWTDFLEGDLEADGLAELQALLADHPRLQTAAADMLETHRMLSFTAYEGAIRKEAAAESDAEAFVRRTLHRLPQSEAAFQQAVLRRAAGITAIDPRRRAWYTSSSIAAGLLLGVVCTTVVFAYVGSTGSSRAAKSLLSENFEAGPPPAVTGIPTEPDVWSGDYSEVVTAQSGITPLDGAKMLRFLRGDYLGRTLPNSFGCDVFRLIDVRPYQTEFRAGDGVVQVSALFNSVDHPGSGPFECTVTLFAVDADIVRHSSLKIEGVLSTEALAYSRSSRIVLDRNPATWQKASNELRLPPQTEFVLVRLGVSDVERRKGNTTPGFTGQYVDQVRMVLARRPEIAVP